MPLPVRKAGLCVRAPQAFPALSNDRPTPSPQAQAHLTAFSRPAHWWQAASWPESTGPSLSLVSSFTGRLAARLEAARSGWPGARATQAGSHYDCRWPGRWQPERTQTQMPRFNSPPGSRAGCRRAGGTAPAQY